MSRITLLLAGPLIVAMLPATLNAQDEAEQMIKEALSATIPEMAEGATVVDWENNVLKKGDNGWTCMPSPPGLKNAPMCLDAPWLEWAHAWMNKTDVTINQVGVAYMLVGDAGASNSDPFATEPTDDWVVSGPHLMIIVPDNSTLDGMPTDPKNGGPWVMWKGTPYAHIMVPVR